MVEGEDEKGRKERAREIGAWGDEERRRGRELVCF